MRILTYIRRSKESDERTVSLDQQRASITEYCTRAQLTITHELVDDGISGGNRERLVRIKELLTQHRLDGLVSFHLDRIARDTAAQLDLFAWFSKRHLQIHTVNQGEIRIEQSHEFLSIGVQSMLAEYVRRQAQERGVSTSRHQEKTNKRYSYHAPFGSMFTADMHIVPCPSELSTYSLIMQYSCANKSATWIKNKLNSERKFNRIGTPWSAGSIARIQKRILRTVAQIINSTPITT